MQVTFMLLKPALLLGLSVQLFGIQSLPVMTAELVRFAEVASPLLLLLDGILFATLGLSSWGVLLCLCLLDANFIGGAFIAAVPSVPPAPPAALLSPFAAVVGSVAIFTGGLVGHVFSSALVDKTNKLMMPPLRARDLGLTKPTGKPGSVLSNTSPVDESTPTPLTSHSAGLSGSGSGAGRPATGAELDGDGAMSTASLNLTNHSDVGSVASTATRLAAWELKREQERESERHDDLAAYIRGMISTDAGPGEAPEPAAPDDGKLKND